MNYSENVEKQYHIQVGKGDVGRYVILTGDPKRCAGIAKYLEKAERIADNREYITYTGYIEDNMVSVHSGDIVIATGAVRMEGTSREYAPLEFPAVADIHVINALIKSAESQGVSYHAGVVQCKDSFYGQHSPERMAVGYELSNKWEAWKRLGCLASEMESAALFVVASNLGVRVGSCFLVLANQEREKAGLENPVVHDTDRAIRVAVDGIRHLIREDKEINR